MARFYVEGWAPDYGASTEQDDALVPAEGQVDSTIEVAGDWEPIPGVDDDCPTVAFVDGVRRVEARLTIDDPTDGPIPGICGSFAVGAVLWDRAAGRSHVIDARVERLAVVARGRAEVFPPVPVHPPYRTESVPGSDPFTLVQRLHTWMRRAEGQVAADLADRGHCVIADGPLNDLSPRPVVGYVKSHQVSYLPPELVGFVAGIGPGQRSPLFTLRAYQRYSWYVRLATLPGGHSWTGIVRCEASGALPLDQVRSLADRTAALLPRFASEPQVEPRAPQNLVPIAALERELRRLLGDAGLVQRALRTAAAQKQGEEVA
jgi:hypothetical protein